MCAKLREFSVEGTELDEANVCGYVGASLALGVSAADFDRIVVPATMVGDPRRDLGLEHAGSGER